MDELAVALWLLLIPATLYAFRFTRERNGPFLTTMKVVPCGCFSAYLTYVAIVYALRAWGHFFLRPDVLQYGPLYHALAILCLGGGFAVTVLLLRRVRKKEPTRVLFSGFFALFLAMFLLFSSVLIVFLRQIVFFSPDRNPWTPVELPADTFQLEARSSHPLFSERDFRVRFPDNSTVRLIGSAAGHVEFTLIPLKNGEFHLKSLFFSYLLNPAAKRVRILHETEGRLFAYPMPEEEITSWSWSQRDGKNRFEFNGGAGTEGEDVTELLQEQK